MILKSRKFWAAVAAIAFAIFGERVGISQDVLTNAIYILIAYITGVAVEDGLKAR
jgi:hypothetical protein